MGQSKVARALDRDRRLSKASFLTRVQAARNGTELQLLMKEIDSAKGISAKTFKKLHVAAEVRAKQLLRDLHGLEAPVVEQPKESVAVSKGDNAS